MATDFRLDGFRLGKWTSHQRQKQDSLSPDRKQKLDDIGFVWDARTKAWEEGFSKLLQFKELEGHCRVPAKSAFNGFKLGRWVDKQRITQGSLSPDRKQKLNDIGFVWNILAEAWEHGFEKLLQFREVEGHCRVPFGLVYDGFRLGQWVARQRIVKDSMSTERKQRLDGIGFIWIPRKT